MIRRQPKTRKSLLMGNLYGEGYSKKVFRRLQELDPEFNRLTQEIAYDRFWARKGLGIRDKSLVTVAALIAMGKEEQTKIHMRGFLRSGGTADELKGILFHLIVYCGFPAAMNGFSALKDVQEKMEDGESPANKAFQLTRARRSFKARAAERKRQRN